MATIEFPAVSLSNQTPPFDNVPAFNAGLSEADKNNADKLINILASTGAKHALPVPLDLRDNSEVTQDMAPTAAAVLVEFFAALNNILIQDQFGNPLAFKSLAEIPLGAEIVGLRWTNEDGSSYYTTKYTAPNFDSFATICEWGMVQALRLQTSQDALDSSDTDHIVELVIRRNAVTVQAVDQSRPE